MAIRARPKPRPDVALHHDIKFSFARQISERRVTDRAAEAGRVMFILSFRCWDCLNVICAARHMSVGRFESWAPGSSLLKLVPLPRSEITCYCFAPALHCSAVLANCQYGLTTKARPHRVITYLEVLLLQRHRHRRRVQMESRYYFAFLANCEMKSIGTGNIMVEFFSAAIELNVWKQKKNSILNHGLSAIMSIAHIFSFCNLYYDHHVVVCTRPAR